MIVIPNRVSVAAVMLALALVGGLLTLVLLAKHTQAQPPPTTKTKKRCSRGVPARLQSRYHPVRRW